MLGKSRLRGGAWLDRLWLLPAPEGAAPAPVQPVPTAFSLSQLLPFTLGQIKAKHHGTHHAHTRHAPAAPDALRNRRTVSKAEHCYDAAWLPTSAPHNTSLNHIQHMIHPSPTQLDTTAADLGPHSFFPAPPRPHDLGDKITPCITELFRRARRNGNHRHHVEGRDGLSPGDRQR